MDMDAPGLALVHERLAVVLPDLDAVTDPGNSVARKPATFSGCVVDNSGDLYQPELEREWNLQGSARVPHDLQVTSGGRR